ncbi:PTCHD3 [Branchiostoma lanceolatum]|uniref:PTCHD3 protein n=1 Tax=Branchiostoma lanceolatum TaxID=7740 RepID=A0A8J9YYJ2_BRALA|nr:PTCHD3 [Branchiostoma lanceolatum]
MVCMWIDKRVRRVFKQWGVAVARRPEPLIILPIVATVLLGYFGLIQVAVDDNFDSLFTPSHGQAEQDVARLQALGFEPSDLTLAAAARVIVQASDGGNVLREEVLQEVLRLHDVVYNVSNDRGDNFTTLCRNSSIDGSCYGNNMVRLLITNGTAILGNLEYPYHGVDSSDNTSRQFIGDELGGVRTGSDGKTVREARALQLSYHLQTPEGQWMENFLQAIESFTPDNITVTYLTATSLSSELGGMPGRLLPYLGGCAGMVALYSVLSFIMVDCVRSEPWLGLMGSLTSLMALTSAVGLLQLCGQKLNTLEMAAIFILIGSKFGNTHTLLWAWRRTDPTLSVRHRMGAAMADAASPMAIGSLTDYVTYAAGMATSFPVVRSFCILAMIAVAFTDMYRLMFFAAFLALSGHREDGNRHCLTCLRVRTSSSQSPCYALCCAGDGMPAAHVEKRLSVMRNVTKEDMQNPLLVAPSNVFPRSKNASVHSAATFPLYPPQAEHTDSPEHAPPNTADPLLADFFSSYFGQWLKNPWMKFVIVLVYLAYLGAAIRGCILVQPVLNYNNLAADDSHVTSFAAQETEYFNLYGPRIDLVVTNRGKFSDQEVEEAVEQKLQSFSQSPLFHNYHDVWLRSYAESSRVSVLAKDATTGSRQTEIMSEARRIATTGDVEMLAYAPQFALYEQLTTVLPEGLMVTGIATAAIFASTFLLVPHWTGGFVVVTSGASVMVGVVGYMALWDVKFDVVATAAILASVALATDLPAHVTYAYVVALRTSKLSNCVVAAMHTAGMPAAQSAVSTILSLVLLAVCPAETYRAFFKIILLTVLFSTAHSFLFLPVLLSFMAPCFPTTSHRKKAGTPSEGGRTNANESGVTAPWQEHLDQLDKHISLWEQTEFRSSISDATPSAIGSRMLSTFSSFSTSPTADSLYRGQEQGERQNPRQAPQRSNSMFGPRTSLDLSLFENRRRMSSRDVVMPSARLANHHQERSVTDGAQPSRRLYKYGKKEAQDSMRYRLVFPHEDYYRQATRNGNAVVHRRESSGESASRPMFAEDASDYSRPRLHKQDSHLSVISNPRSVSSIEDELITPRAVVGHPLPGMPKRNSRISREPSRDFSSPRDREHTPHVEIKGRDERMSLPVIPQLPDPKQHTDQRRSVDQANSNIRYSGDMHQKKHAPNKLLNEEMKAWIGWVMDLKRKDMEVSII